VCQYLRVENRPGDHLSIFTYNSAGKSFKHLGLSQDYKALEEPTTIEGNVWTAPLSDVGPKGEKIDFRNVWEFVSPDRHLAREDYSTDGGQHWTTLWSQVATRVP
jgi:hypothetical protein